MRLNWKFILQCFESEGFLCYLRIFSDAAGLLMGVRLLPVLLTGMGVSVWLLQCLYSMIMCEVNAMCLCCRFVYIWDTTSRRILYKLPGHAGSVNEVAFHPEEPIGKKRLFYSNNIIYNKHYKASTCFPYCLFTHFCSMCNSIILCLPQFCLDPVISASTSERFNNCVFVCANAVSVCD